MAKKSDIKALGHRIDELRQQRNLSFQEMADLCHMDKAQVYKICSHGVDLRYSSLVKVAEGLKIPLSELLYF